MEFCEDVYYGYIIKADLTGAIRYVKQFPEKRDLYNRYLAIFGRKQYITYEIDAGLNEILALYQQYYRDAFYLGAGTELAEENLRTRLAGFLGIARGGAELSDMEQNQIAELFSGQGLHFLGGKTSGYCGPYVWQTTEIRTYEVELPDGIQPYTVKLLDGFIARSWMDYLSFGKIGPGGWTEDNGIINCVTSAYDLESEDFKVSLLKHEAQHARDLSAHRDMPSEELEYRAKLVELIYSRERNLLERFVREADSSDKRNGHSTASDRIVKGYAGMLGKDPAEFGLLPIGQIQGMAKLLFEESGKRLDG